MKDLDVVNSGSSDHDAFFGVLTAPTATASIRGLCGDAMTFHLRIQDGVIEDVRYETDGCGHTRAYGAAVAARAKGKPLLEALAIHPKGIMEEQGARLGEESRHCAILAVMTLFKAIAAHLLESEANLESERESTP
jgi:nitrogen fixation NifU-like protein